MRGWVRTRGRNWVRTFFLPRRQLKRTMRTGTRGGSRLLAGGTCSAVVALCAGTLQGDEAARLGFEFLGSFCPSLCNDRCWGAFQLSTSPSSCVSLRRLLEEFLHFLHAQFTLGNLVWLRIWQSHVLCLGVACGTPKIEIFRRFCGYSRNAWRQ